MFWPCKCTFPMPIKSFKSSERQTETEKLRQGRGQMMYSSSVVQSGSSVKQRPLLQPEGAVSLIRTTTSRWTTLEIIIYRINTYSWRRKPGVDNQLPQKVMFSYSLYSLLQCPPVIKHANSGYFNMSYHYSHKYLFDW